MVMDGVQLSFNNCINNCMDQKLMSILCCVSF